MEKTIKIDGKEIRLKSTAGSLLRYKMQFGTDMLSDLLAMVNSTEFLKGENINETTIAENLSNIKIDTMVFFNILWTFAKTADESIPEPLSWLDSFDGIDIFSVQDVLLELVTKSMNKSNEKGKKPFQPKKGVKNKNKRIQKQYYI